MTREKANAELQKMKDKLARWLAVRARNDARGVPVVRDHVTESKLAAQLKALLYEVYPDNRVDLDQYDVTKLAAIVVTGKLPETAPMAQGLIPLIWIGVAAAAIVIIYSIKTYADKLKDDEERAACRAGDTEYCPTPWGTYALVGFVAWLVFRKPTPSRGRAKGRR